MKMIKYIIKASRAAASRDRISSLGFAVATAALSAISLPAMAQDLKTEVVVDRIVEPAERAATRLGGLTPELVLPVFSPVSVKPSIYDRLSPLTRSFTRLDPAAGPAAAEPSPYRGYAAIGYFPTLNLGATAGYRILDSDKFRLGVCMQADGERYKPLKDGGNADAMQAWNFNVGADFGWRLDDRSSLTASAGYGFLRQQNLYWHPQNVNSGKIALGWDSRVDMVRYKLGFSAKMEKSAETSLIVPPLGSRIIIDGVGQQQIGFVAEGSVPVGAQGGFGIAVDGDFLHTQTTLGCLGLTPAYTVALGNLSAKVGLKVDFSVGTPGSKVHVAPDISLQWAALPCFGVSASVGGGTVLNPFSTLRQESIYQVFTHEYSSSDVPVVAELGLNFGPFTGFTGELFGGYAKADDWLMMTTNVVDGYEEVDISGWHVGMRLGYSLSFLDVSVSGELFPSAYDKAWLYNRDRAKYMVGASAKYRPLKGLEVGLDYEFRGHRFAYSPTGEGMSLGCKSDLSASVSYRVTDSFTVFARAENLLSRRYMMTVAGLSQKICGLVGVEYKF